MSTTGLKIIALVLMLIDHIGQFIIGTPEWFRWIGRISAPLFMFCTSWGFYYTRNRKKYLLRMYLSGLIMAFLVLFMNYHRLPKYDVSVTNNIFVTLLMICSIVYIIEEIGKQPNRGRKVLTYFSCWQICSTILIILFVNNSPFNKLGNMFYGALLGNIFYNEGGIIYTLLGVLLYFFKHNKKQLSFAYMAFCAVFFAGSFISIGSRILARIDYYLPGNIVDIFRVLFSLFGVDRVSITPISFKYIFNYSYAMFLALPFMLMYNGKKGKGFKYLFYLFYPIHILIIYYIGNILSMSTTI